LILLGADLSAQDARGMTALMHAAAGGDHDFLSAYYELYRISWEQDAAKRKERLLGLAGIDRELLAEREVDLVRLDRNGLEVQIDVPGETASLKAARAGDWESFQLVANTVDSLRARGKDGRNAVMHFAAKGALAPFAQLRDARQFGQAGSRQGFVGAWVALDVGQLALRDGEGKTALQLARDQGHTEVADILERHLQKLLGNLSEDLARIGSSGLTNREFSDEASYLPEAPNETGADWRARVTRAVLRQRLETRALAWEALGEQEKARGDRAQAIEP
jgi:ankyrin repeat protein